MKPVRLIIVSLASLLVFFGLSHSALAVTGTCSSTQLSPGQVLTVTGGSGSPGEAVTLYFGTTVIGGSTVDGAGFFTVSGTVPSGATPGTYTIAVGAPISGGTTPCSVTVVPAATPTPTPVPTATPIATPVVTTAPPVAAATFPPFVFVPVSVSQQQQQQQQQAGGGGGGASAAPQHQGGGGGGQQQQQQQSGGGILPRTGVDIGKTAGWGAGLLAFGLLLVMFARRRRRIARSRALAMLPPIDAVLVESDEPWVPGTAHPSEFLTEADGVPPVYLPEVEQLYLPPAPEADADDDVLTPSF
jgi:hypothetical protein